MDDINDIKELVARALDRKKVLSKLRAELRAHVFVTIEEEETGSGGEGLGKKTSNPQREAFLNTPEGQTIVELVHEFLEWSSMEFTLKVYQPEISAGFELRSRGELTRQLGLSSSTDGPLLLALLQGQHSEGVGQRPSTALAPAGPPPAAAAPPPQPQQRPLQPLPKLEPVSGRGPLPPVQPKALSPTALTAPSPPAPVPAPVPAAPPPKPSASGQVKKEPSGGSDSYSLDIESDDGLEASEIVDEDEDYVAAVGGSMAPEPKPTAAPPPPQPPAAPPPPAADLSDSNLSISSFTPGRIRPGRQSGSKLSASDIGESSARPEAQLMRPEIRDLMSGDRSFGSSRELDGASFADEPPGGLTHSGELPRYPESQSVTASREDLPKPRALSPLAPLAPLGGKGLAPLAPIGGPLGTALGPALGGSARPLKKPGGDIKDELRRAGLLTLPSDSYSVDSSIDPDMRASGGQTPQSTQPSNLRPPPPAITVRPAQGGVYDGEFSVSNSMDAMPEREYRAELAMSNLSMDLRDPSGLSPVDRSIDDMENLFDNVDIAETAEWN